MTELKDLYIQQALLDRNLCGLRPLSAKARDERADLEIELAQCERDLKDLIDKKYNNSWGVNMKKDLIYGGIIGILLLVGTFACISREIERADQTVCNETGCKYYSVK